MPTYEYKCGDCSHRFERFQKMSDDPVTECESCGGSVQRMLFPVAVHFKGSGFYTTDYARKKTLAASSGNGGASETSADSGRNGDSSEKAAPGEKAGSGEKAAAPAECAACPGKDTSACAASGASAS